MPWIYVSFELISLFRCDLPSSPMPDGGRLEFLIIYLLASSRIWVWSYSRRCFICLYICMCWHVWTYAYVYMPYRQFNNSERFQFNNFRFQNENSKNICWRIFAIQIFYFCSQTNFISKFYILYVCMLVCMYVCDWHRRQ